jgi:hypothetical protein
MLLHPFILDSKVHVLQEMLNDSSLALGDLPGAREASIQIAKLRKMCSQYSNRFPVEAILIGPEKKKNLNKAKGEFKSRLGKQNKLVDKLIVRVFQESLIRSGEKPHLVKRSRGRIQKIVETANKNIYENSTSQCSRYLKGRYR